MSALSEIFPDLLSLERQALAFQFKKFEIQADGEDRVNIVFPSKSSLVELKHELQRYSLIVLNLVIIILTTKTFVFIYIFIYIEK
jgi:hypothetical protein